jgi:hypothetical protein
MYVVVCVYQIAGGFFLCRLGGARHCQLALVVISVIFIG